MMKQRRKQQLLSLGCLAVAALFWVTTVHLFFQPGGAELRAPATSPRAQSLLQGQLAFWGGEPGDRGDAPRPEPDPARVERMRANNPEWDFMGRTFTVLALANLALSEPEQREHHLAVMDDIIDRTLATEAEHGAEHFLMAYWRWAPFVAEPARTIFVEGELAMMLAARQLIEERDEYRPLLRRRIDTVIAQLQAGPMLSGESYPDECWTVCNSFALAAIRVADIVHGEDHSELLQRWLANAREQLIDRDTGMLVSEYTYSGRHLDGPEGSSIFLVAHLLQLLDADFARDQYQRARRELGVEVAGFAYAAEWPRSWRDPFADVDSGPTIPVAEANAGASGMAILGAAAFDDQPFLRGLLASLDFAAFPISDRQGLRYGASNQVGDALLLYALVQGPLWERVLNSERSAA